MPSTEHTKDPHAPHLTVVRTDDGWEIQEHRDDAIVRVARYTDWHRVERSVQAFELLAQTHAAGS